MSTSSLAITSQLSADQINSRARVTHKFALTRGLQVKGEELIDRITSFQAQLRTQLHSKNEEVTHHNVIHILKFFQNEIKFLLFWKRELELSLAQINLLSSVMRNLQNVLANPVEYFHPMNILEQNFLQPIFDGIEQFYKLSTLEAQKHESQANDIDFELILTYLSSASMLKIKSGLNNTYLRILVSDTSVMPLEFISNSQINHANINHLLAFLAIYYKDNIRLYCAEDRLFNDLNLCAQFASHQIKSLNIDSKVGDVGAIALANATSLECLSISLGNIGELGGIALSKLPHIRGLHLTGNFLTGPAIAEIASNTSITDLSLSFNKVRNTAQRFSFDGDNAWTEAILKATNLTSLDLSYNFISALFAASLAQSLKLTRLRLEDCKLEDTAVMPFTNNSSIRCLILSINLLTGASAKALAANTTITYLNLGTNKKISDAGPIAFAGNKTLLYLNLVHTECSNAVPLSLNSTLTSLSLNHNNLNHASAITLLSMTNLTALGLHTDSALDFGIELLILDFTKNTSLTRLVQNNLSSPWTDHLASNAKRLQAQRSEFVRSVIQWLRMLNTDLSNQGKFQHIPGDLKKIILLSFGLDTHLGWMPHQVSQLVSYLTDNIDKINRLLCKEVPLTFYSQKSNRRDSLQYQYTEQYRLFHMPDRVGRLPLTQGCEDDLVAKKSIT